MKTDFITKPYINTYIPKVPLKQEQPYPQVSFGEKMPRKQNVLTNLRLLGLDNTVINSLVQYKKLSGDKEILDTINSYINGNSYPYLKHIIKNNLLCKKEFTKFVFSSANSEFKDPNNWYKLEDLYTQMYLPIINSPKNKNIPLNQREFYAKEIIELKLKDPEEFKKLQALGIIELIKTGKISLNIMSKYYAGARFLPEIYEDIIRLQQGESLIKEFDSLKDVLRHTHAGDVISVQGNLYINNNGKLEPWQMTKEAFEELFPLVDRFVTAQGADDCYLITVLNNLYKNPITRGNYYKMFEQQGNDIYVTIPAYKEYGGKIKFKDGKIKTIGTNATAPKNVQMLERAYSRLSFRYPKEEGEPNIINPLTTRNLSFLQNRIRFGIENETMEEFYTPKNCNLIEVKPNKKNAINLLENYASNPNYIVTGGLDTTGYGNLHSITIESYDKLNKIIYFTDPEKSWQLQRQHLDDFLQEADDIIVIRLK